MKASSTDTWNISAERLTCRWQRVLSLKVLCQWESFAVMWKSDWQNFGPFILWKKFLGSNPLAPTVSPTEFFLNIWKRRWTYVEMFHIATHEGLFNTILYRIIVHCFLLHPCQQTSCQSCHKWILKTGIGITLVPKQMLEQIHELCWCRKMFLAGTHWWRLEMV